MKINKVFLPLLTVFLLTISACFAQSPTQTLTVSGLKENVVVRKDARGIPYIEAKSDADLYFAQGYVTASDRLWQMDLYRRVARGQTAELFGRQTLEEDKRWRRFGFSNIVAETYKNFSPESRAIVDNYARGVNAYVATLNEKTLPTEFQVLRYRPTEWLPTDSLVIGAIITDGLSTTWQSDVLRASFADLPKEKFDRLFMEKTPLDVLIVGKDGEVQSSNSKVQSLKSETGNRKPETGISIDNSLLELALTDAEIRKSSLRRIGFYQESNWMSNNWVVSGKRTADGKPMLANDPHLPASAPSVWYLTHLSTNDSRVSGVTFPGIPGIVLGHNENIAWGATNLGPDVQDLYIETFNDKNQYKTADGWQDAKIRREEIKVRKNLLSPETESETLEVQETRNGVIISEQAGKKYALKWTALDAKNDSFTAFLLLDRAKNWEDFKSALKTYGGATQNFVYADVKGNIGYYGAGKIPIRRTGDGSIPYDGATNAGDWTGFVPFEDLPNSFNPPEGIIVTANQRVAGDSYKYFLTHSWASPYRARRIYELLESNPKLTVNDFKNIQNDIFSISYSNFAREIVKLGAASKESLNVLQNWDGKMAADSKGALLTNEIGRIFVRKILTANVGGQRAERLGWGNLSSFVDWIIREKPANWLPKEFADYKQIMIISEREARENLTKKYGADETKWVWGNAARASFSHPLASAPLIGGLFAVEAFSQNGSGTTPNVGASVSMRHITIPGNWDATLHGIALGESGDPKSPHYKDQLESWKSGDTQIFPFTKPAVEKAAREVILMKP
ncbi:MAG: penicillin acylase family protein [Acidobacteriota bacterium]|nr:penicillin acylase family protein [Acidobacteriota bacterium]